MIMRGRWYAVPGLMALVVCALIAAGCGTTTSSEATTSTAAASGSDKIDAAVKSCGTKAQELSPEAASTALQAACTTVGDNAKQALAKGGAQVDQALSQAADSCKSAVSQLPAGEAQSALTDLCDAVSSAE
jgi:hypothetical protein